jgi:nucleoid-associated protein YgaU
MPRLTPPPGTGIAVPSAGRLGSLLRVPIDYIFEVREANGQLSSQIPPLSLPLAPTVYQQVRNPPTKVSYTLTGTHIDRGLQKDHVIQLQGQSGNKVRVGYNRNGEVIYQSGRVILEEFDVFLNQYQNYASVTPGAYLIFRSLQEGFHYKVELLSWDWSLDANKNKFSYQWRLQLKAYANAPAPALVSIFHPVDEMVQKVADAIGVASAGVALADNAINNVGAAVNQLLAPVRALNALGQSLQTTLDSTRGLGTFLTKGIAAEFERAAASMSRAFTSLYEVSSDYAASTTPGVAFGVASLESARERRAIIRQVEESRTSNLTALGFLGGAPQDIDTDRISPTTAQERRFLREAPYTGNKQIALRNSTTHTLRAGEDLRALALRVYGDSSEWTTIAAFNDMQSANIKSDGSLLKTGDVLYVPSLDDSTDYEASTNRSSDPYLVDLLLVDGDLNFADGDLETVRGVENLQQAITLKTRTILGETVLYPGIGLPDVVGAPITERLLAYLSVVIFEQVQIDPRIEGLSDVEFLIEGDNLLARFDATPRTGLAFPVETVIRSA